MSIILLIPSIGGISFLYFLVVSLMYIVKVFMKKFLIITFLIIISQTLGFCQPLESTPQLQPSPPPKPVSPTFSGPYAPLKNEFYKVSNPEEYNNTSTHRAEKILFIVDFSNSMSEMMGKQKKIDIALATMSNILPKIPPATNVGLRVYGHKLGMTQLQGCSASQLLVKPGPDNALNIEAALYKMHPRGWTPITYSLKQAVNSDFAGYLGKKRIILLTDGGENCDRSPCEWAMELIRTRDDIIIDVVAFDLNDIEAANQLRCTSLVTSGKFYDAKNPDSLTDSLMESLNIRKNVQGIILPKK